jgi:hypothetical protein
MKTVRLLLLTLTLSILFQGWSFAQTADQPTGTGTSEDPYLIATLNNLYWVTQNSSSWDKHFKQTADIDATTTSGWDGNAGFLPIGNSTTPFTGTYNGQGGVISNLTINRPSTSFIGMFGMVEGGEIENLGVDADAAGSRYVGAIAGYVSFSSTVSKCQTYGTVSGDNFVGGIIGSLEDGSTLDKCGSLADVTGERYVGGLAGRNLATITDCYASGSVNGSVSDEGGLVGGNTSTPTVSNSFWDTETSTLAVSAGGTGKTTTEMKTLATFTSTTTSGLTTSWDFIGKPNDDAGIADWWNMQASINSGYPVLSWNAFAIEPDGLGTEASPYQIATLNNLYWLSQLSTTYSEYVYVEQTADIAAYSTSYINSGQGFLPVGNPDYFIGSYNGQQHEIAGLFINRSTTSQVGFFSNLHDESTVFDLHLNELDILGNSQVGGLVGFAGASDIIIRRSSCSGNVEAIQSQVGLLAGTLNHAEMIVEECWTEGTVTGFSEVGGLIGKCGGNLSIEISMSDCYSRADVIADNTAGGLIGKLLKGIYTGVQIEHCYSTGTVSGNSDVGGLFGYEAEDLSQVTLTANLWDTESSETTDGVGNIDPDPDGITGKTTTQMKTQSTFTDAGWDFVGESANGTDDIWDIDGTGVTNDGYPYLSYQPTDMTWTGTSGTSWTDAANWSGSNEAPTAVKSVIIPDVANNPVIGTAVDVAGLTIQSGGILTIAYNGSLTVNGTLANAAGNSGLIIQSTAAGTGSLISASVSIPATVQRYIDGSSAWHLVSSPVNGATAETYAGHYLQFFTEATANWADIVEPATTLTPAQGYALWSGEETYTFEGNLNSGDVSIATTQAYEDPDDNVFYGWNLLGNPYPSSIDWAQLDDTWGAVYYYTGTTYATWNNGAQTNGGTQYVAPGQGFFISSDGSNFQLTDAMRTHAGTSDYFKSEIANSEMLLLQVSNAQGSDEACIRFNAEASDNFDRQFDAWKIMAGTDITGQLYTFANNGALSIDTRPACNTVQLGFSSNASGQFSFTLTEISNIPDATLEDTKTGMRTNLREKPCTFHWEPGDDEMRFKLHLNAVGIEETPIGESNILIYAADGQIFIKNGNGVETHGRASIQYVTVTDMMGRIAWQQEIPEGDLVAIPVNLQTGVYLVTLQNGKEIKTEKVFIE